MDHDSELMVLSWPHPYHLPLNRRVTIRAMKYGQCIDKIPQRMRRMCLSLANPPLFLSEEARSLRFRAAYLSFIHIIFHWSSLKKISVLSSAKPALLLLLHNQMIALDDDLLLSPRQRTLASEEIQCAPHF